MQKSQWHGLLEPREAVMAGVAGLAIVWPLIYYAYHSGFVFWGYIPQQWKNFGTAVDLLSFVVPYLLVKWWVRRR